MDPLSDILKALKLDHYVSGGFYLGSETAYRFPSHAGIKCYAVANGSCWLRMEREPSAMHLQEGDCVLLSHGEPFCLMVDPTQTCADFPCNSRELLVEPEPAPQSQFCLIVGGHFVLTEGISDSLPITLPSVVHIRRQAETTALRISFEQMIEELRDPQPGGFLVAQQAAQTMLIQALRHCLRERSDSKPGWLFALAEPRIATAIQAIHKDPGRRWTLQSLAKHVGMSRTVLAEQFKKKAGMTVFEYLTRWRMILASERLKHSNEPVLSMATSLGYGTESAFGRAFRASWGCSPRDHRNKYR